MFRRFPSDFFSQICVQIRPGLQFLLVFGLFLQSFNVNSLRICGLRVLLIQRFSHFLQCFWQVSQQICQISLDQTRLDQFRLYQIRLGQTSLDQIRLDQSRLEKASPSWPRRNFLLPRGLFSQQNSIQGQPLSEIKARFF